MISIAAVAIPSPSAAEQAPYLAMTVDRLLDDYGPSTDGSPKPRIFVQVRNSLSRTGIQTLRDLLVIGTEQVEETRNFGSTSMELLEKAIGALDPRIVWHRKPSAEYAATLCTNAAQVPARRFSVHFERAIPEIGLPFRATLTDVVKLTPEQIHNALSTSLSPVDEEEAQALYQKIQSYAQAFDKALKQKLIT